MTPRQVTIHPIQRVGHGTKRAGWGCTIPAGRAARTARAGDQVVIVDQLAAGAARAVRDAPAHQFGRAGHDLGDGLVELQPEGLVEGVVLLVAPAFDDAEEAVAQLALERRA